jgi:hypothetical protein
MQMNKENCLEALNKGMEHCDPGNGYSHGLAGSVGCLDYSIDLSGSTKEGNPPWAEQHAFPTPEDLPGHSVKPDCAASRYWSDRPLTDFDLERAIDAYCVDGKEIKGAGKYGENDFHFPPKGQPQFYQDDSYTMHIALRAETINNGARAPYYDMNWCK